MMRITISTIVLLLISGSSLHSQITFSWEDKRLILVEDIKLTSPIQHNLPIDDSEDSRIKHFKKYFNPGSLAQFRMMYLPSDWIQLDQSEFDQWQAILNATPLFLEQYKVLEDPLSGQTYLSLQYRMETSDYILNESAEFKWVNNSWMHIQYERDLHGVMMSRIGEVQQNYIDELKGKKIVQFDLSKVGDSNLRKAIEKFDRLEIFNAFVPVLKSKGLDDDDVLEFQQLFLNRLDNQLVETLHTRFNWPISDIVSSINQVSGFSLFTYASSVQHEK